ncbi:MAG: hypothetical protein E7530_02800 [Ruminococcaceae bacterium]|nr:hypothetical protein [Oscillospiraceae bacterium]
MKRVLKSSLSLFLAFTVIFGSAAVGLSEVDFSGLFTVKAKAANSGTCGENLTWTLDDNGTLTISGTGDMTNFSSPSTAPWSDVTSVVMEEGVTTIGDYAFCNNTNLTSVIIPDSVTTIGISSFERCSSLDDVTIPDNVEKMGRSAFAYCRNLKTIKFGKGLTSIASGAFEECTGFEYVVIPDNVKTIEAYAFYNCTNIASVVIPEGVTSIDSDAFFGCAKISSITIPDSVTNICSSSFAGSAYYTDEKNWENGELYIGDILMKTKNSEMIGHYDVKEGTRIIAGLAFACRNNLTSITIPDSVTNIGESAFRECCSLESVTLSNNLKYIEGWTFIDCSALKSITIPDSVTIIKRNAFERCWNLESITIPDSVTHIDPSGLALTRYYRRDKNWENGVLYINNHLIKADESIRGHYNIRYGTKTIAGDAFASCTDLTSVTIPDTVTNICNTYYNSGAFGKCIGLKSIVIPASVTTIESCAFSFCSGLEEVEISEGVTSIGSAAFRGCEDLNSITIPESVTSIGGYAFSGCKEIATVTIPANVSSVEKYAFSDCSSLVSVTINEGVTSIGEGAFNGATLLSSITIPDSVTNIGKYAFGFDGKTNKTDNFVVCGIPGTIAETYANENDFLFVDAEHTHNAPDWKTVKEPTVNSPGIKLKECTVCRAAVEIQMVTQYTPAAPEVCVENETSWVDVTWNEVDGADEYIVYRREYNPKNKKWSGWSRIADGLRQTYYLDRNAKSGTYYIYTVKARNEGGYGSYTSGAKIYYLSTPKLISLENNNKSITFKWEKVEGATGYIVYRRDMSDSWSGWKKVATTKGDTYVDKKAQIGVKYKYTVRAYYGSSRSYFHTAGLEITILTTPKLKSVSCSKNGATIKWNEVKGTHFYYVYRRDYDAKTKKWSGWTRVSDRVSGETYVDKTAKSGKYYLYTVKAIARAGTDYDVSGYDKTGLKIYFLATPSLKSATSTKSGVKLQWNKISGASGYKIYRKTGNNPWGEAIATVKGNSTITYVDKTAKKGVTYTYTVRAYNGTTKSGYIPEGKTVKDKY